MLDLSCYECMYFSTTNDMDATVAGICKLHHKCVPAFYWCEKCQARELT